MRIRIGLKKACLALLIAMAGTGNVRAQVVTGHYQPLFGAGLKSGVMTTREGFIYQNGSLFYNTRDFRDGDGNQIGQNTELNVWAMRNALVWIPGVKLAGADYGTAIIVPLSNLDPNPIFVDGQPRDAGIGIGDIAISPIMLGWHWTQMHAQLGYLLFTPSGRFSEGAADNTGKGFWTHMPYFGLTWMPPGDHSWHVSLMTRYEMHSRQEGLDLRPGDTLTLEFGVGKKVTDSLELGVIAHRYMQVTGASGADVTSDQRYSSFGAGIEAGYPIAGKVPTKLRVGTDFGAKNISQGLWVMLEFNFLL